MADLPFQLPAPLAARLRAALDVEGKIPRALDALGPLAGRDVALLDVPEGLHVTRLRELGVEVTHLESGGASGLAAAPASFDAIVGLWSSFRGLDHGALAHVDRVLRPGGRLLVVHDYGRDDVSALRPPDAPEAAWSRRDGPFLRAGFKIHVLHCFWTFATLEEAQTFLREAFGGPGETLGGGLRRPRLSWKVAVYHRTRGATARPGRGATGRPGRGATGRPGRGPATLAR